MIKCSSTMIQTTTTYYTTVDKCRIVIENVPCYKCSECEHELFTLETMKRIRDLKKLVKSMMRLCVLDYKEIA